jgi:hypothetical protein
MRYGCPPAVRILGIQIQINAYRVQCRSKISNAISIKQILKDAVSSMNALWVQPTAAPNANTKLIHTECNASCKVDDAISIK